MDRNYQEDDEKSIDFKASCISYFIVHLYQKPDGKKIKYFYWNDLKSLYTEESEHRMTKYIKSTELKEFYTSMKEALANTKDRNFMKRYGVEFQETKKMDVQYDGFKRIYGFRWEFRSSNNQLDYEYVKEKYIEFRKNARSPKKILSTEIYSPVTLISSVESLTPISPSVYVDFNQEVVDRSTGEKVIIAELMKKVKILEYRVIASEMESLRRKRLSKEITVSESDDIRCEDPAATPWGRKKFKIDQPLSEQKENLENNEPKVWSGLNSLF